MSYALTTNNINMNVATSSSNATVDDISNDIGRMVISKDNSDISVRDVSGGEEEMIASEKKDTSCEQKLEIKRDGTLSGRASGDIGSDIDIRDICANCGKEGGVINTCNKCKSVQYCNATCKKKHRKKHKKDCEEHVRRNAMLQEEEMKRAAELLDIVLLKEPTKQEDECPICFQCLPRLSTGKKYKSCCGKMICSGCVHAVIIRSKKTAIPLCSFCRTVEPTSEEEVIKRLQKRVELNDTQAITTMGFYYSQGMDGLPKDHTKAFELWEHAAELGHADAYFNIGCAYATGRGVEKDRKKAQQCMGLGAIRGDATARHSLGVFEWNADNGGRAINHFIIAVRGGSSQSLKQIQDFYSEGYVTKEVYTEALLSYQKYLHEVKSRQRDEAAAADDEYKYLE